MLIRQGHLCRGAAGQPAGPLSVPRAPSQKPDFSWQALKGRGVSQPGNQEHRPGSLCVPGPSRWAARPLPAPPCVPWAGVTSEPAREVLQVMLCAPPSWGRAEPGGFKGLGSYRHGVPWPPRCCTASARVPGASLDPTISGTLCPRPSPPQGRPHACSLAALVNTPCWTRQPCLVCKH